MVRRVIDANLAIALILPLAYSEAVAGWMNQWQESGDDLFAPVLWEYEVVSALRKTVAGGAITSEDAAAGVGRLFGLGVQIVTPDPERHLRALWWAEKLNQTVAYDAQYLATAERLGAEFWTADRRLVNSVQPLGIPWVHWTGEGGN